MSQKISIRSRCLMCRERLTTYCHEKKKAAFKISLEKLSSKNLNLEEENTSVCSQCFLAVSITEETKQRFHNLEEEVKELERNLSEKLGDFEAVSKLFKRQLNEIVELTGNCSQCSQTITKCDIKGVLGQESMKLAKVKEEVRMKTAILEEWIRIPTFRNKVAHVTIKIENVKEQLTEERINGETSNSTAPAESFATERGRSIPVLNADSQAAPIEAIDPSNNILAPQSICDVQNYDNLDMQNLNEADSSGQNEISPSVNQINASESNENAVATRKSGRSKQLPLHFALNHKSSSPPRRSDRGRQTSSNFSSNETRKVQNKPQNDLKCSFCPASFKHKSTKNTHERIHTGEKPYRCIWCNKRFAQLSTLQKHERVHTRERPYLCTVCKRSFNSSSNLKRHEKICHRK